MIFIEKYPVYSKSIVPMSLYCHDYESALLMRERVVYEKFYRFIKSTVFCPYFVSAW